MLHLYRLICAVLLMCVGSSAFADGAAFAAPPGQFDASSCNPTNYPKPFFFFDDPGAWACSATSNPNIQQCGWNYTQSNSAMHVSCNQMRLPSSCPSNATASSGSSGEPMCTCSAGYTPNNGTCEAKNEDKERCASFAISQTLPGGSLVQDYRLQGNVADGAQFCMPGAFDSPSKGCKVSFSRDAFLDYGGGASVTEGTFSMASNSSTVDQSCSVGPNSSPPKVPEKEKCPNGYTGTVNGVEVCVNKVPDSGVGNNSDEETTDTETETRRVTRNSTTECKNGTCTTTITTTTTVTTKPGGATSTSTSTTITTGSQAGFCKENPGTKMCSNGDEKGVGDVGSVTGGKTHGQPTLYETKYPNGIKGVWEDSGIAGADGKFGQLASALMPSIADGNGGCLSFTVPLSVGIVDFGVLDVSPPCLIWPFIRICVLITALWLARALIFGG